MNKAYVISNSLFLLVLLSTFKSYALPESCVQLPQRTTACPNMLYKRSPVDVAVTEVSKGEIVCICMSDFSNLRIPASTQVNKIEQDAELKMAARKLNMSQQDLLDLIRK